MAQSPEASRFIDKGSYWLRRPNEPDGASLSRVVERDEDGIAIEQTICAFAKWARFVDRNGNVCEVPLSNGRVPSFEPEAERYEMHAIREQILNGSLPLDECPHTTAYHHLIGRVNGGALVKPPEGYKPCHGKPRPADLPHHQEWFGCEHMEAIIKRRREKAYAKWVKQETASDADIKKFKAMAEAITKESANAVDAKANLRAGRGEKDKP